VGTQTRLKPLRVVLDTNVLISALIFGRGRFDWLRHAMASGHLIPLVSSATAQEFIDVLAYPKFGLTEIDRSGLMEEYLPYCEIISIPNPPPRPPPCRDPGDVIFFQLAIAGKATALITGDADLLALVSTFPIPILTPAEMKPQISA
jgi:uncharacterized protein